MNNPATLHLGRPEELAYECGTRVRVLADSTAWLTPPMAVVRQLLFECAISVCPGISALRHLMLALGIVSSADEMLNHLQPEDTKLVWRGFYGAPLLAVQYASDAGLA
jgi:hypothetical protein